MSESASRFRLRRAIAALLVALAGFGFVASVVGVWGARTVLNTDRWVATVAPLPQLPEVNAAIATYLTEEVFSTLNVQQRLEAELPPKISFIAGPITRTVHDYVYGKVRDFMASPQFQTLWKAANHYAHTKVMAILNGQSKVVSAKGSTVTLNLLPIVDDALVAISKQLPTLFGKQLQLPTLTSGQIPPNLRQSIENAVGVKLPADFAQITLYNRNTLSQLQTAVVIFKRSVVLLIIGSVLCLVVAVWVSPSRRRTTLQFGLALAISVVVLTAIMKVVRNQLLAHVPAGTYRTGASVAMREVFTLLRQRGDQLLWLGIIIALVAYLAGPGRLPTALRYKIKGSRSTPFSGMLTRYRDPLRIAGAIIAALLVLAVPTWTSFLIVLVALIAYEALLTLLTHQPPPPATQSP